ALLERGLLQSARHELGRELAAERVRARRDRAYLRRIRRVLVVRALALARADPEDECDDDRDRDRDQPDEARERDEPRGRRGRARAAGTFAAGPPTRAWSLLRLRLVEEVELDVLVVVGGHAQEEVAPDCNRRGKRCPLPRPRRGDPPPLANVTSPMSSVLALQQSEPVLGRYRPLRPLGSGGSGSVWLARDEKTGLDVALKIVAREGKAAARAEREAAAAARLRHPSCLRAYSFARDSRHVYIAYEFIPGRTVREALRAGELDDAAAVEACAQVAEGLAHAHRAGILHRDVKPSNVLLAEGGRVSAKLLDFGLAQMAEAETLTAQGDVPGTLAYISPERLAGDDATEASDVWAVGVMLWEALAGRHPFWQTSMLETARAIEAGAPSLATLRPDLPKALLQLVDRSLSLSPSRRPSAADLADALRGAAAHHRRTRPRPLGLSFPVQPGRAAAAALAAAFAGGAAALLPFFPHGWAIGLGLLAASLTAVRPRAGLALALAVPVLPLGNVSLGLAVLYGALALAWLVLCWPEPNGGLLFALGPLLAPLSAIALVPLAAATL